MLQIEEYLAIFFKSFVLKMMHCWTISIFCDTRLKAKCGWEGGANTAAFVVTM